MLSHKDRVQSAKIAEKVVRQHIIDQGGFVEHGDFTLWFDKFLGMKIGEWEIRFIADFFGRTPHGGLRHYDVAFNAEGGLTIIEYRPVVTANISLE